MDLLQPLLFSLQATEEDLTLLLPQLMQNPFFNPSQKNYEFFNVEPSAILSGARIRLGVKVDTIIYELLSSFCTRGSGSKQADTLINAALNTSYSLPTSAQAFQFKCQNGPPLVPNGYIMSANSPIGEDCDSSGDEVITTPGLTNVPQQLHSKSSLASSGIGSSTKDRESITDFPEFQPPIVSRMRSLSNTSGERRSSGASVRKGSVIAFPPSWSTRTASAGSDSSLFVRKGSEQSESSILGDNRWQASIDPPSNDMIIGCYSENTYSILMWNPKFKVEFELGSEEDGMCTTTYCVNPTKPSVSLHVVNSNDVPIAFSIRAYRQSLMFRSHVIYPRDGLKDLDAHEEFWQDFDVVGSEGVKRDEHIIIDLLVCKLHGEPSWNIQRRYIILKFSEEER